MQPNLQQIEKPQAIEQADLVVGVPTFNHQATIANVVAAAVNACESYFPGTSWIVYHYDAGSRDSTAEEAKRGAGGRSNFAQLTQNGDTLQKFANATTGSPGRGYTVRRILRAALDFGAKSCVILDPDRVNMQPAWIDLLARPVVDQGYDFVSPYYLRHRFEGAINTSMMLPVTRALYGKRLRQPVVTEFACSRPLMEHYASLTTWDREPHFNVELGFTTQAISVRAKLCQVCLGTKVADGSDPGLDLSSVMSQVSTALFLDMERNAALWQKVRGSEIVDSLGSESPIEEPSAGPEPGPLIDSFLLGFRNLREIWNTVIAPGSAVELLKLSRLPREQFRLPDLLWTRIVYDFAVAYHMRTVHRDHLLRALTPLYLGWLASFVLEMQQVPASQMEPRIEQLCLTFEAQKPYLISRWRWPDRFNP